MTMKKTAALGTCNSPPPHSTTGDRHVHHDNDSPGSDNINVARIKTLPNGAHGSLSLPIDGDERPTKKRKLSIRVSGTGHKQTTIHQHFAARQQPTKPPSTRVTIQEPHGQLLQTINGVTNALDAGEDDLLNASPKPRRATRSPQPAPPTQQRKQEDKRTLRSQDEGPRLKSELAIYFPNYEDIIFDAPNEEDFLTVDTALYITDDSAKSLKPETATPAKTNKTSNSRRTSVNGTAAPPPPLTPQRSSSGQFNGSPSLNFDFVAKNIPDDIEDPLTAAHFLKAHKRAERKEKQLRNIEKERAMHEKVQLERILDGLQGHDWLRVLGISGVTDTEAKKYEAKRHYFIVEVKALVDKFKQWKEQEKKQRLDKEAVIAVREAEEEDGNTTEGSIGPPSSDLNASAAKQLQQETANAIRSSFVKPSGKGKERAHGSLPSSHPIQPATPTAAPPKSMLPPPHLSPEVAITSFYVKRHLREAALGRSRHGRNVTAFGQPLPEMDECEFQLPDEYVTEDALRSNARERRRRNRESATNAS